MVTMRRTSSSTCCAIRTLSSVPNVMQTSNRPANTSSSVSPSSSEIGSLDRASTCAIFLPGRWNISKLYS
ncbi:hypothetical protein FWK35_00039203 [Aphis craccivora]|uniref:Uncharacterized protein n=1 Tax=Aphis craccivora TaxID=307492 RepID=A0A6G0VK29_APHCR|nr:hypothetical protein FWK35_00039203 [Aphis craccivora]